MVSNAIFALKEFLEWRRRRTDKREKKEQEEGGRKAGVAGLGYEEDGDEVENEDKAAGLGCVDEGAGLGLVEVGDENRGYAAGEKAGEGEQARGVIRKLRKWEGQCMICEQSGHEAEGCVKDAYLAAMMQAGLEQVGRMREAEIGRAHV